MLYAEKECLFPLLPSFVHFPEEGIQAVSSPRFRRHDLNQKSRLEGDVLGQAESQARLRCPYSCL